jgi:hypothetical protein
MKTAKGSRGVHAAIFEEVRARVAALLEISQYILCACLDGNARAR